MKKKTGQSDLDALADALKTEMIINQALIDLLVAKGIITHDELQAKVKTIKVEGGIVLSSDASEKIVN